MLSGPVAMLMHVCWSMGFWTRVLLPPRGRPEVAHGNDRHLHLHLPPPSLGEAIASVRRQAIPKGVAIRVIVIDNDTRPTARDIVQAQADMAAGGRGSEAGWRSTISTRRDGTSRWRETRRSRRPPRATSRSSTMTKWPSRDGYRRSGRAMLEKRRGGRARPRRPGLSPGRAGLDAGASVHATRPVFVRGEIRTGYTCNVLIDRHRPEIRALRFEPGLGRSGGEDSDYFARVVLMGGRIDYAPEARVTEPVALDRLSFRLAGGAALPDGSDPCGHPDAPSRRVALARGSGGRREASGLRLHGGDLRRGSADGGFGGAARGAACRRRGRPRRSPGAGDLRRDP
jgi:hypothetical protein